MPVNYLELWIAWTIGDLCGPDLGGINEWTEYVSKIIVMSSNTSDNSNVFLISLLETYAHRHAEHCALFMIKLWEIWTHKTSAYTGNCGI